MHLRDLLVDVPGAMLVRGDPATVVTGVGHDSRLVRPGGLFVAMAGRHHDARRFVPRAVERGAAVIVAEAEGGPPADVPPDRAVVVVPSARAALADVAAAFYGHPSRKLRLVGVTGTDGKTTTTRMLAAILERAGRRVGWLTTVDVNIGGQVRPNDLHHTTPEADRVQAVLAEMVTAGVEVAVLETSSHALALDRVRGCAFDVAVFTNLSPEHLNFHGTLDEYRLAKARLFELLGRFNVANWLAAATAAFELGATPEHVVAAAAELAAVSGRMERVERGQPFLVVVDFSHTPQALENALRTLRPHTPGRLMVVFGHAGERDPANRPEMGRVAADLADYVVLSMDDPLHEDPTEIARAIAEGARARGKVEGRDFAIDVDRASAIRALLGRAEPGDTVLLAGKGHERRMLVRDQRLPWNDREEAERALAELGYGAHIGATEQSPV